MAVYLIHIHPPLAHARHYLGYAADERLADRIDQHGTPRGARLTQVAAERGRELVPVRVWWGRDRAFERALKNQRNAPRFCPLCNPALYHLDLPDIYHHMEAS